MSMFCFHNPYRMRIKFPCEATVSPLHCHRSMNRVQLGNLSDERVDNRVHAQSAMRNFNLPQNFHADNNVVPKGTCAI